MRDGNKIPHWPKRMKDAGPKAAKARKENAAAEDKIKSLEENLAKARAELSAFKKGPIGKQVVIRSAALGTIPGPMDLKPSGRQVG